MFIGNSNQIIEHMKKCFNPNILHNSRSTHMYLLLMENCRSQCNLLGVNFHGVWYCKAVVDWFRPVMGYLEIRNQSDLKKDVIKHANSFKNTGIYVDVGLNFSDFNRFRQFELAYTVWKSWRVDAYLMSENNQQMKDLLIQCGEINKKLIKSIEPDAGSYRICRFCLSVFNVKTSPDKWKSCGSRNCKLAYIRANREKNHPKRQWVHDPTALKPCIGGCGSNRKKLNSNRVCFTCYKPFS
jgi:hypothetical protein